LGRVILSFPEDSLAIICNALGVAFVGIGVAVSMSVTAIVGIHSEGGTMMILGPVVLVADLAFRLLHKDGHWLSPTRGGHLFFLPVWMFGLLWIVLGAVYLHRGDSADRSSHASKTSISQTQLLGSPALLLWRSPAAPPWMTMNENSST
jgi:hypothetical protein